MKMERGKKELSNVSRQETSHLYPPPSEEKKQERIFFGGERGENEDE